MTRQTTESIKVTKKPPQSDDRLSQAEAERLTDGRQSEAALAIQRGMVRALGLQNIACLPEVPLPNHRRADLMAVTDKGEIWIIEIKSGLADFQADQKWPQYLPYCDRFYFAVAADFPTDILPDTVGYWLADAYGAEMLRETQETKLAAARRHVLLRRMARIGGYRWARLMDPKIG